MTSWNEHIKKCSDLYSKRQQLLPPKERRLLPEDPYSSLGPGASKAQMQAAESAAQNNALDMCPFCQRSFLPEKLAIHNKSCTAEHPSRKVTDAVRRGGLGWASRGAAATLGAELTDTNETGIRPRPRTGGGALNSTGRAGRRPGTGNSREVTHHNSASGSALARTAPAEILSSSGSSIRRISGKISESTDVAALRASLRQTVDALACAGETGADKFELRRQRNHLEERLDALEQAAGTPRSARSAHSAVHSASALDAEMHTMEELLPCPDCG